MTFFPFALKLKKREFTDRILPLVKGFITIASLSLIFVKKKKKNPLGFRDHRLRRCGPYLEKCPPPSDFSLVASRSSSYWNKVISRFYKDRTYIDRRHGIPKERITDYKIEILYCTTRTTCWLNKNEEKVTREVVFKVTRRINPNCTSGGPE